VKLSAFFAAVQDQKSEVGDQGSGASGH